MAGPLHPPFSLFLPEEKEKTGRARSTGRLLMALPFRAVASPLRGKEKKKYSAFLTVEHPVGADLCVRPPPGSALLSKDESVGAAALRPPLAALPLTAAAYPLRVLRPPLAALPLTAAAYPLRVFGGPSPRAEQNGARLNEWRSQNDFPRVIRFGGGLFFDEWTSSSFRWR